MAYISSLKKISATTNGSGDSENFKPLTARHFWLLIANKDEAASLLEC